MRSTSLRALRSGTPFVLVAALLILLLPAASATADRAMTPYDVAKIQDVGQIVVSPDGRHVAYTRSVPRDPFDDDDGGAWSELHMIGPDGSSRPFITGEVNVSGLDWTPDGSGISFVTKRDGDEHNALYVIARDGGEARKVLEHDTDIASYAWSPDGKRVAFLASEEPPEDKEKLENKGFDQEIYEEELPFTRVYVARPNPGAGMEDDENEPRELKLEGNASELSWSPDGRRLALALAPTPRVDDALMFRKVRVVDVESGEIVGEVDNPGKLGDVVWSPDSKRLALISGADLHDPREGRLMVVPATGGTPTDLMPGLEAHVVDVAWRDADTLYFIVQTGVEASLEQVEADGSSRVVHLAEGGPIWSTLSVSDDGEAVALRADSPAHPDEAFRWRPGQKRAERLTTSNPWLDEIRLAPQEAVAFEARDGLELEGILIRPLDEQEGTRVPLILVVHGGPEAHYSNGWMTAYSTPGQVGAARGFAVFYPNYRGSTGRGVEFSKTSQGDPAGKEFDDLVDAKDHLVETGLVDEAKVGITGGSYGGYASAWGATALTEHFAASVMFVGISEKIAKWGSSDIPQELNLVHDRHWPWEAWDLMLERSPVYHAEKARTPILILHGKEDPRVHPSQSLILYRYLKVLDRTPVRLVWYPGEGHGNRRAAHRLDYSLRQLRWFDHYLQGDGGEPPAPALDYGMPEEEDEADSEGDEEEE